MGVFERVLIANRGEIAVRVIRACRDLGIETVAVYSEADRAALHVRLADRAYACGAAPPRDSYLNGAGIVEIAQRAGADAIHPGYGFLSENGDFSDRCAAAGIAFIGPRGDVIRAMGDKLTARARMRAAGIRVVPGSDGAVSADDAAEIAERIGFPVMLKASAGGGGKGMRRVGDPAELAQALERVRGEAGSYFGDDRLYIEKWLDAPRHIEVQFLVDSGGRAVHLGERECSIQRRHQKLIEETPANGVDAPLREALGAAALAAAGAVGYCGAGTCEFLFSGSEPATADNFYFLEMNTRIQVEHAITEAITGIDLVAEMIRVAAGEALRFEQSEIHFEGHAIETRIYAEDPDRGFMPSAGTIRRYRAPDGPGVRVDSGVESGSQVSIYYDAMVAKLICWGDDRVSATARTLRALEEFAVDGIATTIPFQRRALRDPAFVAGRYATDFIERMQAAPVAAALRADAFRGAALWAYLRDAASAPCSYQIREKKGEFETLRLSAEPIVAGAQRFQIAHEGVHAALDAVSVDAGRLSVLDEDGQQFEVSIVAKGEAGQNLEVRLRGTTWRLELRAVEAAGGWDA